MKFYRQLLLTLILSVVCFFTVSYFACTKDKCNGVACQNKGICDGGNCICKPGYEGNRCEIASRDKIIGNYNGADSCSKVGERGYYIRFYVTPGNKAQMIMKNLLGDPDDSAICNMAYNDSFSFNGNNSAVSYIGSGRYSKDSLFLKYHVQYDTSNYDCEYVGLRH